MKITSLGVGVGLIVGSGPGIFVFGLHDYRLIFPIFLALVGFCLMMYSAYQNRPSKVLHLGWRGDNWPWFD